MVYLDNSATTQPCGAACNAARAAMETGWYNPSALYGAAVQVEKQLQAARKMVADAAGVTAKELVFTGSGTESDTLAILGAAARFRGGRRILLFAGEHPAVRETAGSLTAMGHTVEWIPATDTGLVDMDALDAMLNEHVGLVSCMQVGNETGTVQPIPAIGRMVKAASADALFHVDGIQGFLRMPLDLAAAGVDLYTISAHKVHGLKGTGALFVRKGVRLVPRIPGGGQEGGLRSGTENTAGVAAFSAAVEWMQSHAAIESTLRTMKLRLYDRLCAGIEGLRVNGEAPESPTSAPHILNVSLPAVGGEVMVHALEQENVLVGTGAACSSKKREMSAAFAAMHAPKWAAETAIRFSFGMMNTPEDADVAADAVLRCYDRYKAFQRR